MLNYLHNEWFAMNFYTMIIQQHLQRQESSFRFCYSTITEFSYVNKYM